MTLSDLSTILSDIPLERDLNRPQLQITTLLTDSRSLGDAEHTLFFALRTRRADGHSYIPALYEAGVRAFVVEDTRYIDRFPDADFITVQSTSDALMTVGAANRHCYPVPVIGITGSRGKTMVKEWLYLMLRDDYRITRSPRSYNSQIGVPLSLWQFNSDTTLGIVEAGISAPGEMARLEAAIRPGIVVITSLGEEHSEGFADMEEKALEKLRLASGAGTLIYPASDERLRAAVERAIDHGYFGADAYIDNRTGTLVVRGAAPQPPRPAEPAPAPAPEDQYAALQRQLRQANDAIPDPVMTAKISRLEDVSARIFALAKKDPDKKAQLQKFMDYYLPTALKLLNTYAQLSAQDVQGSNITEAKQSIERSMDLLITAFENQLDKLFQSDALDVSADVAALEGMLNLDGLTGPDFH